MTSGVVAALLAVPHEREALREFAEEVFRELGRHREREEAAREWLATHEAAELLSSSANAVRIRLQRGWLDGNAVKDGSRWLVRKSAILDHLDRKAQR